MTTTTNSATIPEQRFVSDDDLDAPFQVPSRHIYPKHEVLYTNVCRVGWTLIPGSRLQLYLLKEYPMLYCKEAQYVDAANIAFRLVRDIKGDFRINFREHFGLDYISASSDRYDGEDRVAAALLQLLRPIRIINRERTFTFPDSTAVSVVYPDNPPPDGR